MSKKYCLSPTDKINYVQKTKSKGQAGKILKQFSLSFILLGALILIIIPGLKKMKKNKDLRQEISQVQEAIQGHEQFNDELRDLLSYLNSSQAVEEQARLSLGLQREGEQVVVIKKRDNSLDSLLLEEEEKVEKPNPIKWFEYFFN